MKAAAHRRQDRPAYTPRYAAACLLMASFLAGCIAHVHTPYVPRDAVSPSEYANASPFEYSPQPFTVESSIERDIDDYVVHQVQFPAVGENGQDGNLVSGDYYQSKLPGQKPVIIILPIWGTHTYPPEKMTKGIHKRSNGDMHILMLSGRNHLIDWPTLQNTQDESDFVETVERMGERVRTTVIDLRRTVDWLESRGEVDSGRIALMGFSMGAVLGAMLTTNEPRIHTTVLVMGAANPGVIFAHCNGRLQDVREAILERFSWSLDHYQDVFVRAFDRGDPVHFTGKADPSRILMIDAQHDDCMPRSARENLWDALGNPERITFKYRHKQSFLSMTPLGFNIMGRKIYEFLDRSLAL